MYVPPMQTSVKDWWFVRLESLATPFLHPDECLGVELGWQRVCGALHLGELLPQRTKKGRAWNSNNAYTVTILGNRCPGTCKMISSEPRSAIRKRRISGEMCGLNTPDRGGEMTSGM